MRTVAYGSRPLPLPDELNAEIQLPPPPPPETDIEETLSRALAAPIGAPSLASLAHPGARVAVVVSDGTKDEPRGLLFEAVRRELAPVADKNICIAVANGTRGPGAPEALRLGPDLLKRHRLINHDSTDLSSLVDLGTTSRGTRVRIARAVAEADVVVLTGRIKPHYFAGFTGGCMAVFPGLAAREDILKNQELKQHASARLGQVDGNVCRADMEQAVAMLPGRTFLLNVIMASDRVAQAVAGDLVAAHRAGCAWARPHCEVEGDRADIVIVSDALPVTLTLSEAAKLLAPAAGFLRPGGIAILAAECPRGTGPLDVLNESIYRIGIKRYFDSASEPEIYLVSSLPASVVEQTFCHHADSLPDAIARAKSRLGQEAKVLVLPRAGDLIPKTRDL